MKPKFEIVKSIGVLGDTEKPVHKELNFVRWCNQKPVLDIRNWQQKEDGEPVPLKGITLTVEEAKELARLLNELFAEGEVE